MNSEKPHKDHSKTRDALMERIRANEIHMRPRAYFVLKVVALTVLFALILLISILLSNLISFDLRLNGHDRLLGLGWRGIDIALMTFPWWLLIVDIALILLLRFMLKTYSFGYKSAWLPLIGGLLLISGIAGFSLDHGTAFNDMLLRRADDRHLPGPVNNLYAGFRHLPHEENGEYRGLIVRIDGSTLYLATHRQSSTTPLTVELPTAGPDAGRTFKVGQAVVVLGDSKDGVIHAIGIRPIDQYGVPPPVFLPPPPMPAPR